jgi:hypothetical protein
MRWILPLGCLVFLMVIYCGCIQYPAPAPATPVPTTGADVMSPAMPVTRHPLMVVNVTAEQTIDSVIIRVDGGRDAGALTSLSVHLTNYDGTTVQRTITAPAVGKTYSIQYFQNANAKTANIIGTFSDGFQQTLLLTSL